ncbi:hypothetical protein [Kiloniella sp.]|uniref:hypothetical protein n=1 Tax=Kiloniella sp. TaxID=1938587 RepID=UPI003B02C289
MPIQSDLMTSEEVRKLDPNSLNTAHECKGAELNLQRVLLCLEVQFKRYKSGYYGSDRGENWFRNATHAYEQTKLKLEMIKHRAEAILLFKDKKEIAA